MTVQQIMKTLKTKGTASGRKTYLRHGAAEPVYGVRIADMKTILKKTKKDHDLALELWETGNADAQYLAALMADETVVKKSVLDRWARQADWDMLREYGVAGLAAESPHGEALADKWIGAKKATVADAGWATWGGIVAVRPDDELDVSHLRKLLTRVEKEIHQAPNRVRYSMNQFVIAVGCYVEPLHERALKTAAKIGKVDVDMGDTACKVPLATDYIAKVAKMGRVGKKRKAVRC